MDASLATATSDEQAAIKDFNALVAAKTKEINALTKQIESKTSRVGELGVELVTLKEDLDDTTKSLIEDEAFLKDLAKNCKTKEDEWAARQKIRADELVAIADTIKILNDDDALELFKKTLPSSSFIQEQVTTAQMRSQALALLMVARKRNTHSASRVPLELITMALSGNSKMPDFTKVLKMLDELTAALHKEQEDDDTKKEYCEKELDELTAALHKEQEDDDTKK